MASETTPPDDGEPFPWHIGVYDAHCHPTDTMSSISEIPNMKTRCLTVMGTRGQDQSLVTQVADQYGIKSANVETWKREECVVPCFGWHPWFAHMMYIPSEATTTITDDDEANNTNHPPPLQGAAKITHYQQTLQPTRTTPSSTDIQIFSSLPDPLPFTAFLAQLRSNLSTHPLALVGEVGLDRSFRIPEPWDLSSVSTRNEALTPGGREGRRLTPFRCSQTHQKLILRKQLEVAADMGRAASVHGVQAHGMLLETLREMWAGHEREVVSKREMKKRRGGGGEGGSIAATDTQKTRDSDEKEDQALKPYPPRICLHSYSGSASNFKQYLHPSIPVDIFASFSTAINLGDEMDTMTTPESFIETVKAVPDDLLLVESDLHTAGSEMDRRMEDVVRRICRVKGWGIEEGVRRLEGNWRRFVFGG